MPSLNHPQFSLFFPKQFLFIYFLIMRRVKCLVKLGLNGMHTGNDNLLLRYRADMELWYCYALVSARPCLPAFSRSYRGDRYNNSTPAVTHMMKCSRTPWPRFSRHRTMFSTKTWGSIRGREYYWTKIISGKFSSLTSPPSPPQPSQPNRTQIEWIYSNYIFQ